MTLPQHPLLFAAVDHRLNQGRVFGIRPADLARHLYVIGKTGAGKTVLLERLLIAQIRAGMGVALLDPHGDLVERVLDFIPRHRTNDVVLFDPADVEHPMGLNVLEHVAADKRPLVASAVLSVFRKAFAEFWGPRLEHLFRNCLLALLEVRGTTLLGVMRLLVDESYRSHIVARITDPLVRFFWTCEWTSYPKPFLSEIIAPVLNKLGAVLTNPLLRNIVGQPKSTFSCADVMDTGRIFLANLSKGTIGEDASALLGAALVTRFQLAAYARAAVPPADRRPFTLYVDEFASFTSPSFNEILSEARKFGLALVLAHQYLGQLDDSLRQAVIGNMGSLVAFRVGAEDAEQLAKEFDPELTARDLTRLGPHQIALRLSVDGLMTRPFTALTLPPHCDEERVGQGDRLRAASRERYGRRRERVEAWIGAQLPRGRE